MSLFLDFSYSLPFSHRLQKRLAPPPPPPKKKKKKTKKKTTHTHRISKIHSKALRLAYISDKSKFKSINIVSCLKSKVTPN